MDDTATFAAPLFCINCSFSWRFNALTSDSLGSRAISWRSSPAIFPETRRDFKAPVITLRTSECRPEFMPIFLRHSIS